MIQPMPGQPFRGPLPALTDGQLQLAANLEGHVRHLAEHIGPRNFQFYLQLQEAADYLHQCLESYGYQVRRLPYEAGGQVFENLETVGGDGPFTVVGAHYDSVYECPGANDNASGVATVLELARLLKGREELRFVFFCNEEPPFYRTAGMGSRQYVAHLLKEKLPVRAMICLETVGYYTNEPNSQKSPFPGLLPSVGDFVSLVGDVQSAQLVKDLVGRWQGQVPFPCLGLVPTVESEPYLAEAGMGMSDHASFWEVGIPAVMVADTVFYRYRHYHLLSDTWEKLTYQPFARMVDGLAGVLSPS